MPSSGRTTARGGGAAPPPARGDAEDDARVPPFTGNNTDHNPRELRSWARRTGFHPSAFFSGESAVSNSSTATARPPPPPPPLASSRRPPRPPAAAEDDPDPAPPLDLDHQVRPRRRIDLRGELEIPPVEVPAQPEPARRRDGVERLLGERAALNVSRSANGVRADADADTSARKKAEEAEAKRKAEEAEARKKKEDEERDAELAAYYQQQWANEEDGVAGGVQGEETAPLNRPSGLRCGVSENPGWALLVFYGIQHYLSIAGSLVFIPLILVPTMGGSDVDTATVISTMLLVSGLTTILHTFLGSRLPLIQGSSFVYLAPALVIANSEKFRNLNDDKFKHIMRELQGAILVGSVFQIILGYSGLMSLLLRLINPVVVAPTIAAVGLAFFSYGFPHAGSCVEISMPLIVLLLLCTLVCLRDSLLFIK
ncbi:unnamed protein product [Triticum turgidum subsp. durum]|uniref:Nucleobase-ascorbate transporter 11 n=1 Tax=Triticum turgidum subsp. durum TaxID=4567 RepID=A0A9R1NRT2_TRITD|nr:unnamed protein product [Triticum turgidum subsp. durum]